MVTPHCRCCINLAEPSTNQWNYRKQFVATVCPASKLVTSAARLSAAHAVVKVAATCLAARYVFCLFSPPRQCPTPCSKQCCPFVTHPHNGEAPECDSTSRRTYRRDSRAPLRVWRTNSSNLPCSQDGCCRSNIIDSGVACSTSLEAPCIINGGFCKALQIAKSIPANSTLQAAVCLTTTRVVCLLDAT